MDKLEQEVKKDIAKRLKLSNQKLWDSLSFEDREIIVNKYYHSRDIEKVGLVSILENNRQMRKDIGFMFLGISLGLFGNIFINIVFKYFPKDSWIFDLLISVGFIILIYYIIKQFEKFTYEDLDDNNVLGYLIDQVEAEKKEKESEIKSEIVK